MFLQGVCQQQNVLFDFMTVKEHLHFYAGLKEVEAEERDDMVNMIFIFSYWQLIEFIIKVIFENYVKILS